MHINDPTALFTYVFSQSLEKPWIKGKPEAQQVIAKALVYETLKLVAEFFDKELKKQEKH